MGVLGMTTVTAREFNQDVSAAKRAADEGPVTVTDRGEPAYVLLSISDYRRLTGQGGQEFLNAMRMPEDVEIEFERMNFGAREVEW